MSVEIAETTAIKHNLGNRANLGFGGKILCAAKMLVKKLGSDNSQHVALVHSSVILSWKSLMPSTLNFAEPVGARSWKKTNSRQGVLRLRTVSPKTVVMHFFNCWFHLTEQCLDGLDSAWTETTVPIARQEAALAQAPVQRLQDPNQLPVLWQLGFLDGFHAGKLQCSHPRRNQKPGEIAKMRITAQHGREGVHYICRGIILTMFWKMRMADI